MSNLHKLQEYEKAIESNFLISKTDIHGLITYVNKNFCDSLGYMPRELLGQNYAFLLHKDAQKEELTPLHAALDAKQTYKKLFKFQTKNKTTIYHNTVLIPIPNEKKKIVEFLAIGYDATIEIQMIQDLNKTMQSLLHKEQLLMHQSKLSHMSEMIGMIAHQWRQPLAAISATTIDLDIKLALNNFDEEHFSKKFKNITDYTEFLSKTIDDFKNFFAVDANEEVTTFEKIVRSVLSLMDVSLRNRMIGLSLDLEHAKPIKVFSAEVQQIVLGVLKTFEEELTLHKTKNPLITLLAYSEGSNEYLEIVAKEELKQLKEIASKLRVLYVEDNPHTREATAELFQNFFETLFIASDGEEALEMFQTKKVDLIFTDICIPCLNGIELIKRIREEDSVIPIVVLSAYNDSKYLVEAISLNVDGYIIKPINLTKFLAILKKTVLKYRLAKQEQETSLLYKRLGESTKFASAIQHSLIPPAPS